MSPPSPSLFSLIALLLFIITTTLATPTALIAPIIKDHTTNQYTTLINLRTPPTPIKFVVDLGASFLWVDCQNNYTSTSYAPIPCSSPTCTDLDSRACGNCYSPPGPGCANDSCSLFPENPIVHGSALADGMYDALSLPTTDGRNPGKLAIIPHYLLSCSPTFLLKGLAKNASGMAALGRSNYSLPAQIASTFSYRQQFAICLSGSRSSPGPAFFGGGPYFFLPNIDISRSLVYTPLILNPVGDTIITYAGRPSDEYFVGVKSIKVNGKEINLNSTLLSIDENGQGGTKISTVAPYTTLQTTIYESLSSAFIREAIAMNMTRVGSVKPFKACFSSKNLQSTRVGFSVPTIDLVLQTESVVWRVFGANSMVQIEKEDKVCLGFLDGGLNGRTSIVIGGYQLEDNLLEFDLEGLRLGFSSSLLFRETACANFNFTSKASV